MDHILIMKLSSCETFVYVCGCVCVCIDHFAFN